MSPMQLEMLARGESIDVNPDVCPESHLFPTADEAKFNIVPLLSPALTHHAGASTFVSPAGHAAFPANPNAHPNSSSTSYSHNHARSPIEQLQDQHRQFQEQLTQLQQQQRQLQVTAAAVAASTSPNVPTSGPGSGQSRPVSTPGAAHSRSTGSIGTPSPRYFSPLTSPALDGSARATHFAQHHGFSPAFGPQGHRQPHPLSALSSPALNPVGSSGGAQQTLSPALEPQQNGDSGDPEYIRALLGLLNGQAQGENHHQTFNQSPNHQPTLASPLGGPTNGPGPNRQSLPSKTRPSPMMKPTNHHRSQARHSTGSAFSVPSSPMAVRYQP